MTIFFLILSVLFGWIAWNLYHPAYHRWFNTISFLFGWLAGELALHHIAVQVILVALLVWAGAVDGLVGAIGFIICVVAWFAMAWFYLDSNRAARAIGDSLAEGLGENYEDGIRKEFVSRFPEAPDCERIKRPWGNVDPEVEVIKDHPFGVNGLTLDIYRSRRDSQSRPVLLQIHGGAWTEKLGSKDHQAIPLMNHMALRDWICVATSYRLSTGAHLPDHLVDCQAALDWFRHNIRDLGGDPEFVVVTGGSAGGH
ncbi:MAG: alpha/beta hydrolase, partial [Pseudomonadales bacterium]|nr:alpha/beta hydrolase [Pseudomonadales bacterium]